jgi:hypothetical protein
MDAIEKQATGALRAFAKANGLEYTSGRVGITAPDGAWVVAWKWTHTAGVTYAVRSPCGGMKRTEDHQTPDAAARAAGWLPTAETAAPAALEAVS